MVRAVLLGSSLELPKRRLSFGRDSLRLIILFVQGTRNATVRTCKDYSKASLKPVCPFAAVRNGNGVVCWVSSVCMSQEEIVYHAAMSCCGWKRSRCLSAQGCLVEHLDDRLATAG